MKHPFILTILFVLVLGAGIGEHFFIKKTFNFMNNKVSTIEEAIETNDIALAKNATNELQNYWLKKKIIVETISYCVDTKQINVFIAEIQGSLVANDIKNAYGKLISLYQLLDNVKSALDFNIRDIV